MGLFLVILSSPTMQIQFLITAPSGLTVLETFDVYSLEELENKVKSVLNLKPEFKAVITYYDDEGDKIKLTCAPEYTEAINFAVQNGNFLAIVVEENGDNEPSVPIPEEKPEQPKPKPVNPLEGLGKLFGGNNSPFGSFVNNLIQNSEEVFGINQESIEKASQNLQEFISEGVKEFEPILENIAENIDSAFENPEPKVPLFKPEIELVDVHVDIEEEQPKQVEQPKGVAHAAICDHCEKYIFGVRYKCINCPDFDLCESCEGPSSGHDENHVFAKIYRTDQHLPQNDVPFFPKRGGCGRKRGFGGPKRRVVQLEKDVEELKQTVQALIEKKQQEQVKQPIFEPQVVIDEPEEPSVIIEDVIEDAEDVAEEPIEEKEQLSEATKQMLQMLEQMGFCDRETNLEALTANNNDLEATLNTLLA